MTSVPLTRQTDEVVNRLFEETHRTELRKTLLESAGENLPFCSLSTPELIERIRMAILRVVSEGTSLECALELAQADWRDLLVMAGFGELGADQEWYRNVVRPD